MKIGNKMDGRTIELPRNAKTREAVLNDLCKNESKTIRELVQETGKKGCYGACKHFEKIGILIPENRTKHTLWDPITGLVVTEENYGWIAARDSEFTENLRKRYHAEGMGDDEIEERLSRYHLCNMDVPYMLWSLSKDWAILEE